MSEKSRRRIEFFKKAPLSKTMKMTPTWEHFFCGLCIGQWGLGIIWRKKKLACEDDESQMQQQHRANDLQEIEE